MISIRWPETTNTHDFTGNVHRVRKRERTLVSVYTKQRRIAFVSSTTNADVDYDKTFLRMSDSTSHPWNSSLGLFPRCSPAASCKTLSLSLFFSSLFSRWLCAVAQYYRLSCTFSGETTPAKRSRIRFSRQRQADTLLFVLRIRFASKFRWFLLNARIETPSLSASCYSYRFLFNSMQT